jgi:hypothetical protein
MLKKILISIFLLFVALNLVVSVGAQEEAAATKRWFCLEADPSGGHRAKLYTKDNAAAGEKPLANHETIIVECIATDAGQQCTTGNAALDQELYGGSQISADLGYKFQGLFAADGETPITQPIPGNPSGTFAPVIWQDATTRSHERKWLGLNLVEPKPDVDMGQGGEQLGTFDFEFALQKCVNIAWDPYGRIFDSQNLEPVSGASVTLLKKRDNGIFTYVNPADPNDVPGGALINPMPTLEDGAYSFVVPDGTYKLSVQKAGYDFPAASVLNLNFSKIYSDIYPTQTGVEIVQAGAIQHRDIPVDAQGGSISTPAKVMEYIYESDKLGNVMVEGRTSHPMAVVNFYSVIPDANDPEVKTRYRLISTINADAKGRFTAVIDQSQFDAEVGETFGEVEATNVDLTLAAKKQNLLEKALGFVQNLVVRDVGAQTSSSTVLKLDPIPSYLEGYAYDSKGDPIPNAKVSIVLNFTTKAYYQTVADENGFFTIHSDYMPFQPYKLTYSSPQTGTISVSTAKFLTDNKAYIVENKVEAYKPNYIDPKVNEQIKAKLTVTAAAANNQFGNNEGTPGQGGQNGPGSTANMGFIAMVALIIVLLVAAGAVVMYMVKKNSERSF